MSKMLNPAATGTVNEFLNEAPDMEEQVDESVEDEELEDEPKDPIEALLMDFPDGPPRDLIERWKAGYGSVHAYVPTQTDLFLIRPLRRLEYKNIATDLQKLQTSTAAEQSPSIVEETMHERVVTTCLLYPKDTMSAEKLNFLPAGLLKTLFELIMRNSHFVSTEQALATCYKL